MYSPSHRASGTLRHIQLSAHYLIWAQRALDRLLPDPSRAQELKNLPSAIQAIPVLPDYQPPAAPKVSRRRRNAAGKQARQAQQVQGCRDLAGGQF